MNDRFGLLLQALKTAGRRTLVIGDLVASRSSDHTFKPADLQRGFMELQVPPPGNIGQALSDLGKRGLVLSHGKGTWSLTPNGRARVRELVGDSADVVAGQSINAPGAEFAHVQHTVIPPWAAPPRWQVALKRLLANHPFETNVFCMTRFPSEGPTPDPVRDAVEVIRDRLARFGLTVHLASDRLVDDDLLTNVGAYMWGSLYGLGIVEDRAESGVNYNAVIELGGMIVTGRRCGILKDTDVNALPTDLAGQVYKSVDLSDMTAIAAEIDTWAEQDLDLKRV
jgi:hypothetical protein